MERRERVFQSVFSLRVGSKGMDIRVILSHPFPSFPFFRTYYTRRVTFNLLIIAEFLRNESSLEKEGNGIIDEESDLIGRDEYVYRIINANKRITFYTVKWIIIFIRDSGELQYRNFTRGYVPTKYPTLICIKGLPVT